MHVIVKKNKKSSKQKFKSLLILQLRENVFFSILCIFSVIYTHII